MKVLLLFVIVVGTPGWLPADGPRTPVAVAASAPSPDVPEMAVLGYLVGSFKTRIDEPGKATGVARGSWAHDGRFIHHQWSRAATESAPAMNGTLLNTYDVEGRTYRQWSFDSTGTVIESAGQWDQETQTMTWTGARNGISHTWNQKLSEDGGFSWDLVMRDSDGTVVYKTRGTLVPSKPVARPVRRPANVR